MRLHLLLRSVSEKPISTSSRNDTQSFLLRPFVEPGKTLRDRLRELAEMRLKKERQLGAQERAAGARPSLKTASSLLERLPITVVDIDRMGKDAFRELLKILCFEGSFEPNGRFLDVSVMLLPELAAEDGPFTRVLSVLLTGHYSNFLALLCSLSEGRA